MVLFVVVCCCFLVVFSLLNSLEKFEVSLVEMAEYFTHASCKQPLAGLKTVEINSEQPTNSLTETDTSTHTHTQA